jgi:hypothetical protein
MKTCRRLLAACSVTALAGLASAQADDSQDILTIDHYVTQVSLVPSIAGQYTQLYVRERARPATIARGGDLADRVVLFVHGAGTPAERVRALYDDYGGDEKILIDLGCASHGYLSSAGYFLLA